MHFTPQAVSAVLTTMLCVFLLHEPHGLASFPNCLIRMKGQVHIEA